MRTISATIVLTMFLGSWVNAAEAVDVDLSKDWRGTFYDLIPLIAECVAIVGKANNEKIYYEQRLRRELIDLGWEHYLVSGFKDKEGYLVLLKKERLILARHSLGLSRRDLREYFEIVLPACEDMNVSFRKAIRIYQAAKSNGSAGHHPPSVSQHAVTDTHDNE